MTDELYKRIWQLSPRVQQMDAFTELTQLTKQLIDVYAEQGRLDQNPFEPSLGRKVNLPFELINQQLQNSICIVTGGLGCVGTILVNELLKFDVKQIVILDKNKAQPEQF
ncbi:MAG: NAD-dependent dehydratase, partial [Bacteroidota bacterium]|nr:NAD-dependent dehydratase [Bacteroidota bacterium]